jgi:serine protease Do
MTESGTRIVIRHLGGSKINQIDQFDLAGLQEITLGRDPKSTVPYDAKRDDEVSRRHAVIRIHNDKEMYFRIADLNSSNGTLLNGERIGGEVELLPEDVVELGSGGPKFAFDVQPRPSYLPSRTRAMGAADADATRLVSVAEVGATAQHSTVADTQQRGTAPGAAQTLSKGPVGRATIMRMLSEERRSGRQLWIAALAAVVVLAILGGGALYWHSQNVAAQLQQQVAAEAARAEAIRSEAADALAKESGLTPADIKRLGDATVYIHNQWQLYDRDTNRPIYQKMIKVDSDWLPAYVKMDDGRLVRWLTLDNDKDGNFKPVGKDHYGSGFVINEQGFILTNKHIAAQWAWPYDDFDYYSWTRGTIYNLKTDRHDVERNVNNVRSLTRWVPESGGYIFEANRAYPISDGERDFYGRNEELTVQFPGTRSGINATMVRSSPDADVAEIKIDTGATLSKLDLAPDNTVEMGQRIILLGYPDVSQETMAVQKQNQAGQIHENVVYIPEPTARQGSVAKLATKSPNSNNQGVEMIGTTGDTFQLDIFASYGDSGGPVINSSGKVIGLLSLKSDSAEHVSFAVPVSYVRELLQPQRNASP